MNVDKAYLLGLVIGGGIFGSNENSFHIRLPYKQWGSISSNPERAGKIAYDIIKVVKPMFYSVYGLDATYSAETKEWDILCDGDLSILKNDLITYGVTPLGEIRKNATISGIVPELIDDNMKRRFIAGLADTIGSTTRSHRRFSNEIQIISFEISGYRYDFVCQLCRLLYSVKCYPDQILWNHPNFHSGNDPYYNSWKKGFKLRVELDQYAEFGSFAFRTKAESAEENRLLQSQKNSAKPCEIRDIYVSKTCVHEDENSSLLPESIRGGHYLHNKHVCAVLGCEHAPYEQIEKLIDNACNYINPFPIIKKGKREEIYDIIHKYPIYSNRTFIENTLDIEEIYQQFRENSNILLYGDSYSCGYPINMIIKGVSFLIAAKNNQLNGKRPRGNMKDIIEDYLKSDNKIFVKVHIPDKLTVIILENDGFAVMIGAENPYVYKNLISRDTNNPYKLIIRKIQEADLDGI